MAEDGRIAILTYHSLDDGNSVLSTSPQRFAEQMRILHDLGTRVIRLDQVAHAVSTAKLTEDLVVLTFDDGFRSVREHGLPILQRYGFPATVFVVTDYCGKANSWPGQPPSIERWPLLHWSEIEEMSAAEATFGSHTRSHPDLTALSQRDVEEELMASKKRIEDATGCPVDALAYPYGAHNRSVRQMTEAHYSLACSTTLDLVRTGSDLYALERLDMCYLRSSVLFRRLFSKEVSAYLGLRKYLRGIRRRASALRR